MIEQKLHKYNGYIAGFLPKWRSQIGLPSESTDKILIELQIYNSREIRDLLRLIVRSNKRLLNKSNCYICKFGETGKSGEILLYEFVHTFKEYKSKIIETWRIPELPEESIIIFLDDLIGTGDQSVEYITKKLNQIVNPSHKLFILCLCATPQGIKNVKENTNVIPIYGALLKEHLHQYLNEGCKKFDAQEKTFLIDLNKKLSNVPGGYGNLGLLLAFYYTVPNNTLPFIWMDGVKYTDRDGSQKKWQALLPRQY